MFHKVGKEFLDKYPGIIFTNTGYTSTTGEGYRILTAFVPEIYKVNHFRNNPDFDFFIHDLAENIGYYFNYFSGTYIKEEKKEGGTLYYIKGHYD